MHVALPLQGTRVLDLTQLLPGPAASTHLADMGADVIKIEDLGIGGADAMAIKAELETLFAAHDLAWWTKRFASADCCVTPELRTDGALHYPHFQVRQLAARISHPTEGDMWQIAPSIKFLG